MGKKKEAKNKASGQKRATRLRGALVIVESPAKCRTIEKILGKNFKVAASMGHIIDLPKSRMGVDLEHDFEPDYIVLPKKRKTLTLLKKQVKAKADLYLACDPDREGEAISYHLGNTLGAGKNVYRVRFQEITPTAVRAAIEKPVQVDMKLVGAQQARRILDRLVGYTLSPLLWKSIAKGLSAGRVQSVALQLICDQERKIQAFVPKEYWSLDANLQRRDADRTTFTATLDKKSKDKIEIHNTEDAERIALEIEKESFKVHSVKTTQKKRSPQAPFTTSKLQQEAYNRLKFRPTRTMSIAQGLYEGVELGQGETVGLITYMRTDSVNISQMAMEEVRKFIPQHYGKEYLPNVPVAYKSKKQAQEAHEAIRPTSVHRTPAQVAHVLTEEQHKLYSLIWSKFVASQMMPALMNQTSAEIKAGEYVFRASGTQITFPGFLKAMSDPESENPDAPLGTNHLPELVKDEILNLLKLERNQHFTKPPPRFTEASLVKILEEEGIGRPSTYAPIIQTLVSRSYVDRQGGALVPTEMGFTVIELLVKHFPKLIDVGFTARMEAELDRVEEGVIDWREVIRDFYNKFSSSLDIAQEAVKSMQKFEQKTNEVCEKCQRPMVIKWGRRGKFMSCAGFPECRNAKSIPTDVGCPQCGAGRLVERRARSGRGRKFYGCSEYPKCEFIANKLPEPNAA
jgi:DNA topoisomerase-1